MPPGDAENCGNTNSFICANVNGVLGRCDGNSAPNGWLLNRPVAR
jgi:hypothetical protein